jgi:hypothetical protein
LIQNLQKKYSLYNPQLELWALLLALYFLWFSPDDYLELNVHLFWSTAQLFTAVTKVILHLENYGEFIIGLTLQFGGNFLIFSPTLLPRLFFLQPFLLAMLVNHFVLALFWLRHGKFIPGIQDHLDNLIPFIVGNSENQFFKIYFFHIED